MSSVLYCTVPSIGCSTICGRLMPAMFSPQQAAAGPRLVLDDGLDRRAFLLQHQLLVARREIGLAARREGLPVKQVLFWTRLRRRRARQKTGNDCKSETHQSTLAPESFTTFAHLTMSSRRNLSNCSIAMPIDI